MSTQHRLHPTRRTVLRSAAWSTAAVTVVVATPNIAAASTGIKITGSAAPGTIVRNQGPKTVVWTMSFTPNQAIAAGSLMVTFTGVTSTTELAMSPGVAWTVGGTSSATYNSAISAGQQVSFTATFTRSDNASGTATAAFSAIGFTGTFGTSADYK